MPRRTKWSVKELEEVAKQYKYRVDFQREAKGAYLSAMRKGILDDICKHMERHIAPKGYWNYDNCKREALKYNTRTDFMRKSASAYNRALENNWLDEICTHMQKGADGYHYMVYAILNRRLNKAYIGITKQHFEQRQKMHRKGGTTRATVIANLHDTEYKVVTGYIYTSQELQRAEEEWANRYESDGFEILNDNRMYGRVGVSQRIYTDDIIAQEASKYTRRVDFKVGSPKHYDAAVNQRILKKVCSHMRGIKPKNYWTKEKCLEEAEKSTDRDDFVRNHKGAYYAAKDNGWLDEIWQETGLRSLMDMSWRRPGTRKEIWCNADEYYELWIHNGRCGCWRMKTLTGHNLEKLVKKFKIGWVPKEDEEWCKWAKEMRKTLGSNR